VHATGALKVPPPGLQSRYVEVGGERWQKLTGFGVVPSLRHKSGARFVNAAPRLLLLFTASKIVMKLLVIGFGGTTVIDTVASVFAVVPSSQGGSNNTDTEFPSAVITEALIL